MSIQIFVIRHGATAWNKEKRLQGKQDLPLSTEGTEQLKGCQIPDQFIDLDWYCSPLQRARQTAQLLEIDSYKIEPAIEEMNWGDWEGQRLPHLRQQLGALMAEQEARGLDLSPPGGESPRQVRTRLLKWLKTLSDKKDIGLVCHKGVMRSLVSAALDWDMKQDCPTKIDWNSGLLFEWHPHSGLTLVEANIALAPDCRNQRGNNSD